LIENKPEAPWIKRTENGIVFTDNIQVFQDLDLNSEENSGISLGFSVFYGIFRFLSVFIGKFHLIFSF